jgi:hypothetical protein
VDAEARSRLQRAIRAYSTEFRQEPSHAQMLPLLRGPLDLREAEGVAAAMLAAAVAANDLPRLSHERIAEIVPTPKNRFALQGASLASLRSIGVVAEVRLRALLCRLRACALGCGTR